MKFVTAKKVQLTTYLFYERTEQNLSQNMLSFTKNTCFYVPLERRIVNSHVFSLEIIKISLIQFSFFLQNTNTPVSYSQLFLNRFYETGYAKKQCLCQILSWQIMSPLNFSKRVCLILLYFCLEIRDSYSIVILVWKWFCGYSIKIGLNLVKKELFVTSYFYT